ncbi:MAG: response regulator [Anaerolineae bacterium]|nr:response regulator [Anaerolineae bacterium]MDH7475315.1 response regulator [Anaerolineae bacterium]
MDDSPVRVLLVDDDEDDYILTRALLAQIHGREYVLQWVATYDAALAEMERRRHDIYLLDYRLGEHNGMELLREALRKGCTAPIILLTGQGDHQVDIEAMEVGAADYLVKGQIDAPLLERSIRYALAHARTWQALRESEERLRRRNRELSMLNGLIAASAAGLEYESILEIASRELALALNLPQAMAILLNEEKTVASVVAEYRDGDRPSLLGETIPVEGNPLFEHFRYYESPLIVHDVRSDPRLGSLRDAFCKRGVVSFLVLPLIVQGDMAGILCLDAFEPHRFSDEEVSLAWSVAEQLAGVLARARLNEERQRLSAAIEQAAEGVLITDTEGTIVYVNPAFERITGYSRAEAIGQTPRLLKSGKHDTTFYEELWTTIRAGQVWHGRFINKKKDGTFYTAESTITPVYNGHGEIVNYVDVQRDVTRELQLEEQYHQAQKMEAVGQLAAGIAHDFNNLLTAINGFAELMRLQLSPEDPLREMTDKILEAGHSAARLVGQLLAFSRKQVVKPRVVNLNDVVANIHKILQRIIGEDIELVTILAPDLWPVKVDLAQMEQVILNLAVNARDAMPDGGRLTIETACEVLCEADSAFYSESPPGEYVVLVVRDTGLGMSEEVKAHIFEPFFTTKEVGKGTGLGLATVYGIVKQSGGNIQVHSEEGQGTIFKIYLPRAEEEPTPLLSTHKVDTPSGRETILLVEDDARVRELVWQILRQQGYSLLEARDGREAQLVAERYTGPIHLLLTDLVMPGLGGKALAEQLIQSRPGLKIIFMSGYTDETIISQDLLAPGVAFLQKPFSPTDLMHKVRVVLDGSK